jgi:hypothetical protein
MIETPSAPKSSASWAVARWSSSSGSCVLRAASAIFACA